MIEDPAKTPDQARTTTDDATKAERYRAAIQACIDHAGSRESEWGDRAVTAFEFLYAALREPVSTDTDPIAEMMKEWIDTASTEDLLRRIRLDPTESPWFVGEIGEYYRDTLIKRRNALDFGEWADISRRVGW